MRLPALFILSVIAGAGLVGLQAYWVYREWKTSEDILGRQVNFAFEKAIDKEYDYRRDSLIHYMEHVVSDTSIVKIEQHYLPEEKQWVSHLYDPANPRDGIQWKDPSYSNVSLDDSVHRNQLIKKFVEDYLVRSITGGTVVFYTQRLGKAWNQTANNLKADAVMLADKFRKELAVYNIATDFDFSFTDTDSIQVSRTSTFITNPVEIHYEGINDRGKRYFAVAKLQRPGWLLLTRLWLPALTTVLLLLLTLYCLWALYKVIIKQKKTDQIKNDFISNMTHELKTPIATISAAVDGLQYFNGLQDPLRAEKYLNTSRHELQRLNELVSKVLELAQFEEHTLHMNREHITAKPFLETIFHSVAMQHAVSFSWEITEQDPLLQVYGDATHLAGVFYNLADNAVRYGYDPVHLRVSLSGNANGTSISLSDNGPGIDKQSLPFIFDKFYRATGSSAKDVKGFGLGLYYASRIIEQHGGSIRVSSTGAGGTTFIIHIAAA